MSTVEVKDILHHYMGVRMRATWPEGDVAELILEWCGSYGNIFGTDLLAEPGTNDDIEINFLEDTEIKLQLFLSRFDDLPHERQLEYHRLCGEYGTDTPESVLWLFKNQVDCFDLIERGLAIVKQEKCEFCKGTGKRLKINGSSGRTNCLVCKGTGVKRKFKGKSIEPITTEAT